MLSLGDQKRYASQLMFAEIGEAGQKKILHSSVLVIGVGGLGSAAAFYLAAAGVGRISLLDHDIVDLSNLQRQILHGHKDLNHLKVVSAQRTLLGFNPGCRIDTHAVRLDEHNVDRYVQDHDFIISAVDNFETKYIISDSCVRQHKPFSHGGVAGFEGQTFTYLPDPRSGCLRCLFPEVHPKEKSKTSGPYPVLGSCAGTIGSIQASEAIKVILGLGQPLQNRLLVHDMKAMTFKEMPFKAELQCPLGHA